MTQIDADRPYSLGHYRHIYTQTDLNTTYRDVHTNRLKKPQTDPYTIYYIGMGTQIDTHTYYSAKRDLPECQKRPTIVSKETYHSVKRDLL